MGLTGITGIRDYRKRGSIPQVAEAINALGIGNYKGNYAQNIAIEKYLRDNGLLKNGHLVEKKEPMRLISMSEGYYPKADLSIPPPATAVVGDPSLWDSDLVASSNPLINLGVPPHPIDFGPHNPMARDATNVKKPIIDVKNPIIDSPVEDTWVVADEDKYPWVKFYRNTEGTYETKQNRQWEGPKADYLWQSLRRAGCKPGDAYCNYTLRAAAINAAKAEKSKRGKQWLADIIRMARGNTAATLAAFQKSPDRWTIMTTPVPGAIALAVDEDAFDANGNIKQGGIYHGHTLIVDSVNPKDGTFLSLEGNGQTNDNMEVINIDGFAPDQGYKEGVVRRLWTPAALAKYKKEKHRKVFFVVPRGI